MKIRFSNLLLFSSILISSTSFATSLHSMNKSQIEKAFFNKTYTSIPVDNLDGKTVNDSNIIYLDGKGLVIGKMSIKPKNEPQIDTGSYKISNKGTIYIQWKHWDFQKHLCFHMYETKNAYIAIDCQNVFHSVFMKSAAMIGNHIN